MREPAAHLLLSCDDRPGGLVKLLSVIAEERVSVITVNHNRLSPNLALGLSRVELLIEVRDKAHQGRIIAALHSYGFPAETID